MSAGSKSNEIRLTRVYDAPVATVWDAFTDPDQAAHWWGPRGFTLTTHSKSLRVGGIWHYTMHGPDGTDYPNKALYHEVERHRKLVYDHGANDERRPLFRVTVLFSESEGRTTMDLTMSLPTAAEAAATRKFIRQAGGNATWDRLAEYLDETQAGRTIFVINRSFDAPVEHVFALWTDPAHLAQWLPPAGFGMQFLRADLRAGGSCLVRMSGGGGVSFHARFDYREIVPPRRIVYQQRFCDANENPAPAPGMPDFPDVLRTTVLFAAEGDAETRVTVIAAIEGTAGTRAIEAFRNERTGMTAGWTGSFDALEAMLATPAAV